MHTDEVIPPLPQSITYLLDENNDIFIEPSTLPPSRMGFDHEIPLKDDIIPFNLQPYRYSIVQKDVVNKFLKDRFPIKD